MLAAILIGAEAGTADRASGVFRDLVVTGRSRLALFAVRVPAAILVTYALLAVAYALALIGTFVFAGGTPTPSVSLILQGAGWIALVSGVIATLTVGSGLAHRFASPNHHRRHRLAGDRHQPPAQHRLAGLSARGTA